MQPDPMTAFRAVLAWCRDERDLPARPVDTCDGCVARRSGQRPSTWSVRRGRRGRPCCPLDEVDVLVGAAMVSFLTQLRALYPTRGRAPAPHCVVLAAVEAVRDTSVDDRDGRVAWHRVAFNVTVENVGLRPSPPRRWASSPRSTPRRRASASSPRPSRASTTSRPGAPVAGQRPLRPVHLPRRHRPRGAVTAAHVEAAKETIIPSGARTSTRWSRGSARSASGASRPDDRGPRAAGRPARRRRRLRRWDSAHPPVGRHLAGANPIYREIIPRRSPG